MSDIGWRADGIQRAVAAGGLELEVYRRPGFTGGKAIRVASFGANAQGFEIQQDPDPREDEDG